MIAAYVKATFFELCPSQHRKSMSFKFFSSIRPRMLFKLLAGRGAPWACLFTAGLAFLPVQAINATEFVNAADFGLLELSPGADATPVFRRAVEACRERRAKGLRIPAGIWHLQPDLAYEKYLSIANNDAGLKRIVFQLDGFDDFTLDATGVSFVCHGSMVPFVVTRSNKVNLIGFSIDWARPFYFQGTVTAIHPDSNAFDVTVHPEIVYELRGTRLVFREKVSRTPSAWKEWAPPPAADLAWEHNLLWNVWFHEDTGRPVLNEQAWAMSPDAHVEEFGPHRLRFFDALPQLPDVGMVLAVNGMQDPNRTSPAIHVDDCSSVTISDVKIHHAGGMGIVMQRTNGATLRGVQVVLPTGKNRFVTTTADATHFNGCRGDILLDNCVFENMLDDATNVHGCYVRVERQIGDRTLLCRRCHSQQRGLVVMAAGDKVRFVGSDDLQPCGEASVVAIRDLNVDVFELTLDAIPPAGLPDRAALYNVTWQPSFTVRNCTVRNNRGRSMLIATSGKVIIESNRIEYSSMAGIQFEGDNSFWWESGPTNEVNIRNNEFINLGGPVLSLIPQIDVTRHPGATYHGGILFENNRIETALRQIAIGRAINGLVFRGNRIVPTHIGKEPVDSERAFVFESGRDIVVENNVFDGTPSLKVVAGGEHSIPQMKGNQGIVPAD